MTQDAIRQCAADIIKKCKTNDPFKISTSLGLNIMYRDIGSLKGMSIVIKRNPFILINQNLHPAMRRVICAHELGHLLLHRGLLSEAALIRRSTQMHLDERPEYEANLFAAALLIDEREAVSLLRDGYSTTEIGKIMHIHPNFVTILLHSLRLKQPPNRRIELPRANFLR